MTQVRVTCPQCGDIDLTIADLRGRICIETGHAEYRFTCTSCKMISVRESDPKTFEILTGAGIHFEPWHLPAELKEIRNGLVICHDDLIEFHNLVHNETDFANAIVALETTN